MSTTTYVFIDKKISGYPLLSGAMSRDKGIFPPANGLN